MTSSSSCITPPDQGLGLSGKPEAKECSSYDDEIQFLIMSKLKEWQKLVAEQDAAYKEYVFSGVKECTLLQCFPYRCVGICHL